MNFPFGNFYASHSGRTPAPTNYPPNFYLHEPCSYCSNPYHSSSNCLSWGQFSNFSHEQVNTNSSILGFESNWSNHSDFSWQAHSTGNYASQFHELHLYEYSQFDNPSSIP
jgi:hypothetical protein